MSTLNQIPTLWEILTVLLTTGVVVLVAAWGFRRKDNFTRLDTAREEGAKEERDKNRESELEHLQTRFNKEFGGNGGGIREAVNAITASLKEIKEVQRDIAKNATSTQTQVTETAVLLGEHIKNHERNHI